VENTKTATVERPLSIPLSLPLGVVERVLRHNQLSSGLESLNFASAIESQVLGTRALAILRDVTVTGASETSFRVFIDAEGLNVSTPSSDPHYVGTFAELDHSGGHGGHTHAVPSYLLDLTDAIQRVYGSRLDSLVQSRFNCNPSPISTHQPRALRLLEELKLLS